MMAVDYYLPLQPFDIRGHMHRQDAPEFAKFVAQFPAVFSPFSG